MTVFVDHQERRNTILEHAFELFAEEGYNGVTYQKIADRCHISRTSIYKYFKDKDQIFIFAIKQSTDKISELLKRVLNRHDLTTVDKIRRALHLTVKLFSENRIFLSVILNYLMNQKQTGANIRRKVRRHTFGLKIFLSRLIQEAVLNRQFRPVNPDLVTAQLYAILESYVLNLTVMEMMDWKDCLQLMNFCLDEYVTEKPGNTRKR